MFEVNLVINPNQDLPIFNFTECPTGSNYREIEGGCYYFQSTQQSTFESAQSDCSTKFPNGGRLFEAQSLEIHEKVLIASREILTNVWFYIGIKNGETVGSDFKFVSSGITVPYISDIVGLENDNSDQCVYVKNSATLYWDDAPCNLSWYSICEHE